MRDDAVLVYPFPDAEKIHYEHIDVVVGDITSRLSESHVHADFDLNNSGHIAFLIHDIVSIGFPIKKPEILSCLKLIGIEGIDERRLSSLLYLLKKIKHIGIEKYSGVDYVYPINPRLNRITFGKDKNKKVFDRQTRFIEIRSTFGFNNKQETQFMKKRRLVMSKIAPKISTVKEELK